MEEPDIENIAFDFHKFFRTINGQNEKENKAIHNLWKAINDVPCGIWKQAFKEILDNTKIKFHEERIIRIEERKRAVKLVVKYHDGTQGALMNMREGIYEGWGK